MTMPASGQAIGATRLGSRLPSPQEQATANQLLRIIASQSEHGQNTTLKVVGDD